jgi:hypothetical protein
MDDDENRFRTLVSAARETSRGMAEAVAGREDDCTVTVKGGQFRFIATMLAQLADTAARGASCECMGRPIDGFRFWVPHDRFTHERERAERLAAEIADLKQTLRFTGDVIGY